MFSYLVLIKPFKNINKNEHAIKLIKSKQLLYRPIFSLELIKLETLEIYIKTNLKTRFI